MANTLTLEQLNSAQLLLHEGKISDFYTLMRDNGYAYAGWAQGVADGDTIAGLAALDYLDDAAMVGAVGPEAEALSDETIKNIKADMAQEYLDTLIDIAKKSGGSVGRDVKAREVWDFHKKAFEANDLGIESWTLNIPFTIMQAYEGEAGLELFWEGLRETEGEGLDAIGRNMVVFTFMMGMAYDPSNGPYESMAEEWLNTMGYVDSFLVGIKGLFKQISELYYGGLSEDVLLTRAMVEIVLGHIAMPTEEQHALIQNIVSLVNDPETARCYIDGVQQLFLGDAADTIPAHDLNAMMSSVAAVFADTRNTTIESLVGLSSDQLQDRAATSIACRYSLLHLIPFVITGNDALYTPHNSKGELDLYDPVTQKGEMTEAYLADRAAFLATLNTFYLTGDSVNTDQIIEFQDEATGQSVSTKHAGDHVSQRYFFGDDDVDNFTGGEDNDHLYGEGGDDKLTGLGGADYMEGGEGHDTYIAGDGDTILDTDGKGQVRFSDTVLVGGVSSANSNVYQSRDGKVTYTLVDHTLTVTADEGNLTIQNFNNLDLGIVLENAQPAPTVDPIGLMEGDSSALTISLGQPAGENGATYELQVSNPDYLTLSGAGVELLDAASGRYRVSVVAGASTLTLQAHALADDGNNIVNAVSLSVNEVIYTQNGQSEPGRLLTQVDLIIDDAHYDPAHAVHDYEPVVNAMEGGRNMTGGDPGGV